MSPDGKPIQVNASALQAAAAQNAVGRHFQLSEITCLPRIFNNFKRHSIYPFMEKGS